MNNREKAVQLVRDFGELTPAELGRAWIARYGNVPKSIRFHRPGDKPSVVRANHYTRCAVTGERVRPWVAIGRSS